MNYKAILVHEDVCNRFNLMCRQKTTLTKTEFLTDLINLYESTSGVRVSDGRTGPVTETIGTGPASIFSPTSTTGGLGLDPAGL